MTSRAFSSGEIAFAIGGALLVQGAFYSLLALYGDSRGEVRREVVETPEEIPIAVTPMLDELPLLKLGTKNPVKPRLPDMWKKVAPRPVKRYEERSAPSEEAKDDPEEIPESKLADKKHEAPPEDAEVVKELEQELEDEEEPPEESALTEEGAEDGSVDGTETDPLKARQIDLYRIKIAGWFASRFSPPALPCDVLVTLATSAVVQVGGDRSITGFSITSPSGNAEFDSKVRGTLQALQGSQLPPPPPLYPDILGSTVSTSFRGNRADCK